MSSDSQEDAELIRRRDLDHMTYLKQQGLSEQDIENTDFPTLATLQGLRAAFRTKYPSLITNVTRLLLDKGEEAIAC